MGGCSTSQPKRPGRRATNPSADREPEEVEPLPEQAVAQAQAQAQARQVQLEGRGSIVRFLRRTATGSPEWGREHVRRQQRRKLTAGSAQRSKAPHRARARQTHQQAQSVLQKGSEPTDPSHAQLCLQLATTTRHSMTPPCHKLAPPAATLDESVSPQTSWHKDLFATADTVNQHAHKPEEHKPARNNFTTIAQVIGELEWSPVQAEQTETANPTELSSRGKPTILLIIKGRSSLTDQELGALSKQFLNNLEEQINRTFSLTTTTTKHYEKDEVGSGPSVSTTPECLTNAQELAAIGASQDIMTRALICQSNKMELQLDLFQTLATYLLDVRTKVTNIEKLLPTTTMRAQCPSSPILEKLCDLLTILRKLVEEVKSTPSNDKARISTLPHQGGQLSPHPRPKYRHSKNEYKELTMSRPWGGQPLLGHHTQPRQRHNVPRRMKIGNHRRDYNPW
ncbi:hypothetical protein NDU88_001458 [Pleurodeles waltl]|uniref:Uncharacterized protein n=1 Tax=Pleurodeles waltl TaxID=8319 RepID=A0AAV7U729_PLEWA|nr:hypothetical protein NDU88_001458 [Pleurodeles waltl]